MFELSKEESFAVMEQAYDKLARKLRDYPSTNNSFSNAWEDLADGGATCDADHALEPVIEILIKEIGPVETWNTWLRAAFNDLEHKADNYAAICDEEGSDE